MRELEFVGLVVMTNEKNKNEYILTTEEPNTKSAPLNAGMMTNIHVSLAWMPVKALLAQGSGISAGTSRILRSMEKTRLMLQRRVSPKQKVRVEAVCFSSWVSSPQR